MKDFVMKDFVLFLSSFETLSSCRASESYTSYIYVHALVDKVKSTVVKIPQWQPVSNGR